MGQLRVSCTRLLARDWRGGPGNTVSDLSDLSYVRAAPVG